MGFLDAIAEPLADLLRAIADWLEEPEEDPEPPVKKPQMVINERGEAEFK